MLDPDGSLWDPFGHVADGLHSSTSCGHCGEMFINMEGVVERQRD